MVYVSYWNDLESRQRAFFREQSPIKWPTFPLDLHSLKMIYKPMMIIIVMIMIMIMIITIIIKQQGSISK